MGELITIKITGPKDGHEDLVVCIKENGFCGVFDSYYLSLDDGVETKLKGIKKVNFVLKNLIKYWIKKIDESNCGEVVYLPIDFSDQYIGCFRIEKNENGLNLCYGHTFTEGWAISPADPGDFSSSISDFKLDRTFKPIFVKQTEFLDSLNKVLTSL